MKLAEISRPYSGVAGRGRPALHYASLILELFAGLSEGSFFGATDFRIL